MLQRRRPAAAQALRRALLTILVAPLLASGASAEDAEAFALRVLRVPGRPTDAYVLPEHADPRWLVVVAVDGQPPDERRAVVIFDRDLDHPPTVHPLGEDVVAFDVAPGPRLVALSARALIAIAADGSRRSVDLDPPLPLPARTRQVSRLAFLGDWDDDGRLDALLPDLGGVRFLPALAPHRARFLRLPEVAEYETPPPDDPVDPGFLEARLVWPSLARGDDDGDGRTDLFAASRFRLDVFRVGPQGLPERPSRRVRLPAFSFEDERRFETSRLRAMPADLDGDGLADLVVHRTVGTLLRSESTTTLHRNPGDGARPDAPPEARLVSPGGLAAVTLRDLDADGRPELIQTFVPFGVVQLLRVLTRRAVEGQLRVLRIEPPGIAGLVESFHAELDYGLDFDAGLVRGVLPNVDGDFDADGRADLIHADGPDAVRVRLGEPGEKGPRFGRSRARIALPGAREAQVADLDGDGLDDVVAWDPLDREGRLWLARNTGALAGREGAAGRPPTPRPADRGGLHPPPGDGAPDARPPAD